MVAAGLGAAPGPREVGETDDVALTEAAIRRPAACGRVAPEEPERPAAEERADVGVAPGFGDAVAAAAAAGFVVAVAAGPAADLLVVFVEVFAFLVAEDAAFALDRLASLPLDAGSPGVGVSG
jgi:hypothetical protein